MPDATVVETIVVKATELVTAVEASERDRSTVLRVTAPFSPRMRARLHVRQNNDDSDPRQVLLTPQQLLAEDYPALPRSDETATTLRSGSGEYSVDRHHDAHTEAVEAWRARLPEFASDRVEVPAFGGPVRLTILASTQQE